MSPARLAARPIRAEVPNARRRSADDAKNSRPALILVLGTILSWSLVVGLYLVLTAL